MELVSISYFYVAGIKYYDQRQLMEEFLLVEASRGSRELHVLNGGEGMEGGA